MYLCMRKYRNMCKPLPEKIHSEYAPDRLYNNN